MAYPISHLRKLTTSFDKIFLFSSTAVETKILIVSLRRAAKVEQVLSLELRKRGEEHHVDVPLLSEDGYAAASEDGYGKRGAHHGATLNARFSGLRMDECVV